MFAKIENDQVVEYPIHDIRRACPNISFPADLSKVTEFPNGYVHVVESTPEPRKFAVPVEKTPAFIDGQWVQQWELQDIPLEEAKARLKEAATAKRWDVETGGITLQNGISVLTGIDDQDRINAVITNMERYELESVDFKAASGWVTLTLQQLRDIGHAITLHVQACFTAERAHHEAIEALESIEDAEDYDLDSGWPG